MKLVTPLFQNMPGFVLLLCAAATVHGQAFSLDWRTIGGGGGISTGGTFAVSGTIGQPVTGVSQGGTFTLTSGFWSQVNAVQTAGAPLLSIALNPELSTVNVSWPRPATGFLLEHVLAIDASPVTGWTLVPPATYQTNATDIFITIPSPAGNNFYRLRKP